MFFHQLGQNLILGPQLRFQGRGALRAPLPVHTRAMILKGRRAILEELLQPAGEHRGMKTVFLTEIGNRNLLNQVPAKDGNFLFRCEALALLFGHGSSRL